MRSVIFSLIKTEEIIRSLSCKNPFCAIVKGLRFSKASEEQIPTATSEETTKRVNYHKNGNLPLFYIKKDTRGGVLYAPFACVLMVEMAGVAPFVPCVHSLSRRGNDQSTGLLTDTYSTTHTLGCRFLPVQLPMLDVIQIGQADACPICVGGDGGS